MADQVLYSGVACITDLMVKEGLINLDFADVRSVMNEMGKAMMGTGESSGEGRAIQAAEAAISNPLLDESSMLGAQGLLISITGGRDMTLFEVDEAATRIREEVDANANIILGATFDENLEGTIRVSVVATGIDSATTGEQQMNKIQTAGAATAISSHAASTSADDASLVAKSTGKARPAASKAPAIDGAIEKIEKAARDLGTNAKPAASAASVEKNGVRIEPFQPQSSVFADVAKEEEFRNALEEELMPKETGFVPPSAETVAEKIATPAIPEIGDFPPIAQAEIEANVTPQRGASDRGPMGLLQKLKSGLGIQEIKAPQTQTRPDVQAPVASEVKTPAGPPPTTQSAAPVVSVQPAVPVSDAKEASPYAPKRGSLDKNGRIVATQPSAADDDQLDIPAFLRRQAN